MKKLLFLAAALVVFTMNTALAAHWVPLVEGADRGPRVTFDADSMKRTQDNLYFWEMVESSSGEYQLRLARKGLKDYDFADAEVAQKKTGQAMVYLYPKEWDEHGSSVHPLRLAWMDKVLAKIDGAKLIDREISLEGVEISSSVIFY